MNRKSNPILAAAGLRGLAIGLVSVYLGLDLAKRNLSASSVGLVVGAGMALVSSAFALVVGSALKIAYDILLYFQFRHLKPLEEQATENA